MREKLLRFPYWSEMLQQGETGNSVIKQQNQNGITTGHVPYEIRITLAPLIDLRAQLCH